MGNIAGKIVLLCGAVIVLSATGGLGQDVGSPRNAPSSIRSEKQQSTYVVDGIALGSIFHFDNPAYREYKCTPSNQFSDFTWCQRSRRDAGQHLILTTSILHKQDGTVAYVNQGVEPAIFVPRGIEDEINRLSKSFNQPARIIRMTHREGFPDAVIASWGMVDLESLRGESIPILASGGNPRQGFLVDFLGDFKRSAQAQLPIYRLVGGSGYVWSASFDKGGVGIYAFSQLMPPRL